MGLKEMDELNDEIIRYSYYIMRIGREKKVKDLDSYVRRKINEKFKDRNKEIINNHLNKRSSTRN